MNVSGIEQFRVADGVLVDVRTPSEFAQGHWPGAINVPLFDDEQRSLVGRAYKQQGRSQAIQLGLRLTGPVLEDLSKEMQGNDKDAKELDSKTIENIKAEAQKFLTKIEQIFMRFCTFLKILRIAGHYL